MVYRHIKPGAIVEGLKAPMIEAIARLAIVFANHRLTLVVTEGTGGKHKDNSLHYKGYGIDVRTRDIPPTMVSTVLHSIIESLGYEFDVVQESDHFHIEYDPRHDGGKDLP